MKRTSAQGRGDPQQSRSLLPCPVSTTLFLSPFSLPCLSFFGLVPGPSRNFLTGFSPSSPFLVAKRFTLLKHSFVQICTVLAKYLFPGDKIHPQEYSNSPLPAHQMPHSPLQAHYTPRAGCLAWHVCDAVFAPASPSSYTHGLSLLSPVSANLLPVL